MNRINNAGLVNRVFMYYLVGVILTFFLAAILASKRGKTRADRILTLWLMAMGLHLLAFYFSVTKQNLLIPSLLGLELPFPLLHGPFLYLYTEEVTLQGTTRRRWILHFVPVLVSYLLFIEFFLLPAGQKIQVYEAEGKGFETVMGINLFLIIMSGIVYVVLSLRRLNSYQRILVNQFSYTKKISLSWLRYLIYGIGLIWISVILGNDASTFGLTVIFIVFIGYFGINQVGIFTQKLSPEPHSGAKELLEIEVVQSGSETRLGPLYNIEKTTGEEAKKGKYQKSSLNAASAENIHAELVQLMSEKRLYTNPELTLAELADALDVHPNNLSQVINTYEQKTFYDYVNSMRVEEFKRIVSLPENQKFNLLGIARDCGFNSKTSFNRNFKSATGLSPTDYVKQASILAE